MVYIFLIMKISLLFPVARKLLNWTLSDLSKRSGIASSSLSEIENGREMRENTKEKIVDAFEYAGVEFLNDGVRLPDFATKRLDSDWFEEIIGDIDLELHDTHKNKQEVLVYGTNDQKTPSYIIEKIRRLIKKGITFREMAQEGDTFLIGDVANYRWISQKNFKNYLTVIYGEKVVLDFGDGGLLINNSQYADYERARFNEVWDKSEPLNIESTADVRY